jgi:hypothetical protein
VPDVDLIANDDPQVYNRTEGGAFAGVIVTDLSGTPRTAALKDADVARGFTGTLAGSRSTAVVTPSPAGRPD